MNNRKLPDDYVEPDIYIDGFFAEQLRNGIEPNYYHNEYGRGGLPKVPEGHTMEVQCSFMLARENKQKKNRVCGSTGVKLWAQKLIQKIKKQI